MSDTEDTANELKTIALEMETISDEAECAGLDMSEYDEYGFPPEHRERIGRAMDVWSCACDDLARSFKEVAAIAKEIADAVSPRKGESDVPALRRPE